MNVVGLDRVRLAHGLGLSGLGLMAFFGWLGIAGAKLGLLLLLLGTLLMPPSLKTLRRDPMIWLGLAIAAYLLWNLYYGVALTEADRREAVADWLWLLGFWLVAWWLGGRLNRLAGVWLLAGAGLLVGMGSYLADPFHLQILMEGHRSGFHLKKPIAFGLYGGALLLGLLLLAPRFWGSGGVRGGAATLRFPVWLVVVLLLVQGVIATQSRGVWWALLAVGLPALALRYRPWRRGMGGGWAIPLTALAMVALVLINLPVLQARLTAEREVLAALVDPGQEAPVSSITLRLNVWQLGWTRWRERPWTGWGAASSPYLVARRDGPDVQDMLTGRPLDHLHNSYLEVLVRFGLVGMGMSVLLLGLLLRWPIRAWRQGRLPGDVALWLLAVFGFTALWALTDFRALHYDWRHYWFWLAGSAYTWRWVSESTDS